MPKLIVLNGPLGIGKSTLARLYADDHPLTLNLDIDTVWAMLGRWREKKDTALPLSKQIAIEMARVTLTAGHDVVIPQIIQDLELMLLLEQLAATCAADYYEILLYADKEESIRRFVERGKSQGYPDGFRTGGTIDTGGHEKLLAQMYDNMMNVADQRPNTIRIKPTHGDPSATYAALLAAVQ